MSTMNGRLLKMESVFPPTPRGLEEIGRKCDAYLRARGLIQPASHYDMGPGKKGRRARSLRRGSPGEDE